jgi:hypothetical protein
MFCLAFAELTSRATAVPPNCRGRLQMGGFFWLPGCTVAGHEIFIVCSERCRMSDLACDMQLYNIVLQHCIKF